ncbi:general substrate transporter [Gigaspora margarita]|uniref:General substrate transporter n=1 Tax=Gigaspora margarita TaxID=4874 RepID=A0A8H3XKV0_GIGMA|nr:general substrate transporter [Gigaspora margarita]
MSISSNNSKLDKDHLTFNELGFNNVEEAVKVTPFVYFMTFIIAIGGFMYGYNSGVISGAMLLLEKDIPMSGFQKGLVVGAMLFGAMVSGIFAGILSDCIGRRVTLLLAAIIFAIGSIILAFTTLLSKNISPIIILVLGRLIVGIAIGLVSMVVPVYIGEISPTIYRGKLVTINILMVTGGEFVSYLISILFSIPDHGWKWLFGIPIIPSFIQLLFIYFIPESPRFLIRRGKIDCAREILSKIYPNVPSEFVQKKIDDIHDTISQDASGSYKQLIRYPNLRPLIIACSLQAFQNLSGFSVTMFYGATIMKMIGFNSAKLDITSSIIITGTNFLSTVVAIFLIDRVGRRRILLYTLIGVIFGLIIISSGFFLITNKVFKSGSCIEYGANCEACLIDDRCRFIMSGTSGTCVQNSDILSEDQSLNACQSTNAQGAWLTLLGLFLYVIAYAIGIGNVPWTIQGELFPLNIRGRAAGISTATNWLVSLTIAASFLPLINKLSIVVTFWLYAVFMIIGIS